MIRVLDPGPQTTVQDLGRRGYLRYGIPESGPVDRAAFVLANRLVGNPDDAAGLECTLRGARLEITTYRADRYDRVSRNPLVEYGDSLAADLLRRDFTVNAMALALPDVRLIDPFGGVADLAAKRLRTPLTPEISFSDDPLRMLRASKPSRSYRAIAVVFETRTSSV